MDDGQMNEQMNYGQMGAQQMDDGKMDEEQQMTREQIDDGQMADV